MLRFKNDNALAMAVSRKWGPPVSDDVHQLTWEFASREFAEKPFPTVASIQTILDAMSGAVTGAAEANPATFIDASLVERLDAGGVLDRLRASIGKA